jgi:hypothetical protein
MSNVYQLEPPTQGKARALRQRQLGVAAACLALRSGAAAWQVVLVTTLGDVEIELWAKEAPKARACCAACFRELF